MRTILSRLIILFASISLIGCGMLTTQAPNTVIVNPIVWAEIDGVLVPSDLVKIGPDTVRVYVKTADGWTLSNNRVNLDGWISSPPPPKDPDVGR